MNIKLAQPVNVEAVVERHFVTLSVFSVVRVVVFVVVVVVFVVVDVVFVVVVVLEIAIVGIVAVRNDKRLK